MRFCSVDANKVLQYVYEKYGSKPEFLWSKFPNNAILRHKDGSKWYAAILSVEKQKLGIDDAGDVEIPDLKCGAVMAGALRDGKCFFPAYHMNKEYWITLLLNGSIPIDEIYALIDLSFDMTKKP